MQHQINILNVPLIVAIRPKAKNGTEISPNQLYTLHSKEVPSTKVAWIQKALIHSTCGSLYYVCNVSYAITSGGTTFMPNFMIIHPLKEVPT
jgi:hypothetical protein